MADTYEVFAVNYGTHTGRRMSESFLGGDPHDTSGKLSYYVWAIVGQGRTFVVDAGFTHESAERRNRKLQYLPREGLAKLNIDATKVQDLIVTHMHFDHAGTLDDFPNARLHIHDDEMDYCTGRCMGHEPLRMAYDVEDVAKMIRRIYKEQAAFHDRDEEIAPGLSVHHVPGHAKGLMAVRVNTKRGHIVLASDASHFYANMEEKRPFPILHNLGEMMESWKKLYRLADSPKHVIPGHDPLIMARYPAADAKLEGMIARLDVAPKG
ncbi:MAG: N-acyl homoserine lactonase family protein [Alphaproteobacteria bacterium]|nr:N-acyl homoserine lactonase family protein [Alphaproteobacteria bacterium]